jgi:galactokinase
LVDRSQTAAERWLGNQVPQTITLASLARELGAVAASAFGAGFGGSVWAMVSPDRAESFAIEWAEKYRSKFPESASASQFFLTRAGPPMIGF